MANAAQEQPVTVPSMQESASVLQIIPPCQRPVLRSPALAGHVFVHAGYGDIRAHNNLEMAVAIVIMLIGGCTAGCRSLLQDSSRCKSLAHPSCHCPTHPAAELAADAAQTNWQSNLAFSFRLHADAGEAGLAAAHVLMLPLPLLLLLPRLLLLMCRCAVHEFCDRHCGCYSQQRL